MTRQCKHIAQHINNRQRLYPGVKERTHQDTTQPRFWKTYNSKLHDALYEIHTHRNASVRAAAPASPMWLPLNSKAVITVLILSRQSLKHT
jgi:hypothetical protein